MSEPKIEFAEWVLSKEGLPYTWPTKENNYSGKDLKFALYKNVYDCSGLITSAIYHVTQGRIDWRANGNCNFLFKQFKDTDDPRFGDLVFYGVGKNCLTHVMMYCSDGKVFGACGGNSDVTNPEIAKKRGARVRFRDRVDYRPDFVAYKRLEL